MVPRWRERDAAQQRVAVGAQQQRERLTQRGPVRGNRLRHRLYGHERRGLMATHVENPMAIDSRPHAKAGLSVTRACFPDHPGGLVPIRR